MKRILYVLSVILFLSVGWFATELFSKDTSFLFAERVMQALANMLGNNGKVNHVDMNEVAEPGTPDTGEGVVYVKSDNTIYFKDEAGVESSMIAGAGGGAPDQDLWLTINADTGTTAASTTTDTLTFTGGTNVDTSIAGDVVTIDVTGGAGDVTAGANLGDNLLIRGDGATKGVQNSGITVSDVDVISDVATMTVTQGIDAVGAVNIQYGSADVTDHTFISDDTGDGTDFVIPDNGINTAEVDWGSSATQIDSDDLPIKLGTGSPTVTDLEAYINNTGSSGFFTGGELSDGGAGTLNVAAGQGSIRTTADDNAQLVSFAWSASSTIAVTDNTTQYVFVDDAGTITLNSNEFLEAQDNLLLGLVTDEAGVIESVYNLGVRLEESIGQAGRFLRRTQSVTYDLRRGGLVFNETGTRNLTLSTGHLWFGRTDYTISALDTSVSGSFDIYYRDGVGGFTKVAAQTQWPNTQYDDGTGTLNTLGVNRWASLWLYVEPDGDSVLLYGRVEHISEAAADTETEPATKPNRLNAGSLLRSKVVFQNGASTGDFMTVVAAPFTTVSASDHPNLSSLTWTSAGHTGTASTLAGFNGGGAATEFTESNYMQTGTYDTDTNNFVDKSETVVIEVNNDSGSTITDGTIVYISDFDVPSDLPEILAADADSAATMPATGIINGDILNGADGEVIISGIWEGDTSSFSVMDELYVSGTAGTLTTTKPTGTALIQKFAIAARIHATQGQLVIIPFRTNDIPNIASANFWLGNGSGVGTAVSMSGDVNMDNAGATTIQANSVDEPDLDVTNAPTDNFILSYNAAGTDFTWIAAGAGDALVANPLSQFAATTSSQLLGVLSDETGTALAVFSNTPTLTTPVLGAATGTTIVLSGASAAAVTSSFRNTTDAVGANAMIRVGNDAASNIVEIRALATSFTSAGSLKASGASVHGDNIGGLSLSAGNAVGDIRFYAGGSSDSDQFMSIEDDGTIDMATATAIILPAASLDGDDINSNIAGRSLVLTAASPDTLDADPELYTDTKCIFIETPTATDDLESFWTTQNQAVTLTKVWCETDTGTVNMDLQIDDGTPADVMGTDLVCASTSVEDSTGLTGAMADGDRLDLVTTSVASAPGRVSICWTFTRDD